jgi:hypothetical protein
VKNRVKERQDPRRIIKKMARMRRKEHARKRD